MNRRGYTLTEMLVVLACMVVMFSLMSQILLLLWSTMREGRAQQEAAVAMTRLTRQFREDVHTAHSAEATDVCELHFADGSLVLYKRNENGLSREESREGKLVQRELFRLPKDASAKFQTEKSDQAQFVELQLAAALSGSSAPTNAQNHRLLIRSLLGREGTQ